MDGFSGFLSQYGAISSFVFAYQGQSMFLEIMAEMDKPSDFVLALRAASLVPLAPGTGHIFTPPLCVLCGGSPMGYT